MNPLPTVCFLTGTLNAFAGAERMTAVIANALAERGYRVFVLSLWDRASVFTLHECVTHQALFEQRPSFKQAYLPTVLGIRRFVREHGIDVLIEVDTMLALFTLPATFGMNVRRIAWEHCHFDEDLGRRARKVARILAARTNAHVVVLTERDRERWTDALRPHGGVVHIPNPLPFPIPETPAPRDSRTVLAVGRLTQAKGFDVLIKAWAKVARIAPDWKLVIVGEGEDRGGLEALRAQLGLEACVSLPGARADITTAYADGAVFCLSSRYEGFGLVLIEAMGFGLPIVSTDCEQGPRELLGPDTAVLVPVDNAAQLANALCKVIQTPETANRLAMLGRERARQFDLAHITDQWAALLG
ncbi:glycosyltransferase involved in cell wall biosynthesis [Cupriavidus metallidurans]|jgi:glycosyltransferase involved in cell wall biosynthesis|uniref:glycosyltransferase family 4 protein n=1 Tax=Cupriavidus TaxID=106589 RepID=UPI0004934F6E|nr:glycosyltransferase family 4 protein [Cupriavidus metallidurans]KWW37247.1 GalNAc-alpha-(1->4)-GalNAc-alpha-(1->3)-diNAcBac-PP-undecaprenol alpha-1,4-N-acetyl-D-galactosaminyltransferase [Cupriavidus metallidurans]MDE4919154.1 glycosyltransferase family 4 protein [Cupriavidus metallidurans]